MLIPVLLMVSALAPYGLGALLARSSGFPGRWPVAVAGLMAVGFLMLSAFASREAYSPGAWGRAVPGSLARPALKPLALGCLALAGGLGLWLQFFRETGVLTIPLGALGILGGYCTFAPPLAWHRRGWGEAWGGLCFGLLPVFTGYYLQSPHVVSEIVLYGLPLSLAAFNLLLLLSFPTPGEEPSPSRGLAARLGPVPGALIFTVVNILTMASLVFCLLFPAVQLFGQSWLWVLVGLALVNQELIKRRAYYHAGRLRLVKHLALALLLGLNLVFGLGVWGRL